MKNRATGPIEILLVEDNPGYVRLTQEAFRDSKVCNDIAIVGDGVEAMAYLKQENEHANAIRPDLILLDLNLPRMNGFEVLDAIKVDESLRRIPVIVLTTSQAEQDILRSYDLHVNAYVTKPVNLEQFITAIRAIEGFWLEIVKFSNGKS